MSYLVVLGMDGRDEAERVLDTLDRLRSEGSLDLEDSALAWSTEDGKVHLQQNVPYAAVGAVQGTGFGALWGTLIGVFAANPLAGLVVGGLAGGAGGAGVGALTDAGIHDELIRDVWRQLQPGRAAVFTLVRRSTPDRVRAALRQHAPTVIHTDLSEDQERELRRALAG